MNVLPTNGYFSMKARLLVLWAIVVLAVLAPARAETLYFLRDNAIDPVALLPAPPSPNSEETRAELDWMLILQSKRTPQQVARCRLDNNLHFTLFRNVIGPWFTTKDLPKVERLLRKMGHDGQGFVAAAKDHFHRQRPVQEDHRLTWACEPVGGMAYPSGHSTWAMLTALTLAELAPEKREVILERGREIGWDRVIAAAHHPSDVMAGRVMGQALWHAFCQCPQFRAELAEAKAEFDEVKRSHAATSQPAAAAAAPMRRPLLTSR